MSNTKNKRPQKQYALHAFEMDGVEYNKGDIVFYNGKHNALTPKKYGKHVTVDAEGAFNEEEELVTINAKVRYRVIEDFEFNDKTMKENDFLELTLVDVKEIGKDKVELAADEDDKAKADEKKPGSVLNRILGN